MRFNMKNAQSKALNMNYLLSYEDHMQIVDSIQI